MYWDKKGHCNLPPGVQGTTVYDLVKGTMKNQRQSSLKKNGGNKENVEEKDEERGLLAKELAFNTVLLFELCCSLYFPFYNFCCVIQPTSMSKKKFKTTVLLLLISFC